MADVGPLHLKKLIMVRLLLLFPPVALVAVGEGALPPAKTGVKRHRYAAPGIIRIVISRSLQ